MIDIRFGYLFFWPIRLVGILCIFVSTLLLAKGVFGAIILTLIGLAVLTATEGTEINSNAKKFREYNSFFFIVKTGKFSSYPAIEYLFITKGKEAQTVHTAHTNHSSTYANTVYNAYLKFTSGEKIQLLRKGDKEFLMKKLIPLSEALQADIVDYA